jgi:hypothetical protein
VGGAGSGGVSSGAAGAGGGGKGGSGGAILDLIGALDGYFMQHPCCGNPQTDDCGICGYVYQGALVQCVNGSSLAEHDFPIGGTPGATYQVTMHFYGILSPKNYGTEVTREAAPSRPGNMNGGAMPPPWAYCATPGCTIPISTYDTREIHVFDHMDREIGTYFLNADSSEVHITYVLNFEKTIPVVGGGRIRMRMFDSNCRIIKNCGSTAGYPCAVKARTVDISAAYPLPPSGNPPAGFSQPGLGECADHGGLWFLLDVIAVSGPM